MLACLVTAYMKIKTTNVVVVIILEPTRNKRPKHKKCMRCTHQPTLPPTRGNSYQLVNNATIFGTKLIGQHLEFSLLSQLTVTHFVAARHVDSLRKEFFVIGGEESALPGIDELVRLARVRGNLLYAVTKPAENELMDFQRRHRE